MTLALALIVFGAVLLDSAITNRSLVDTALAREGKPLASGGDSSVDPSGGGVTTASPGDALKAANDAPTGLGSFDGHPVAKWIIPALQWARKHGWSGHVISGYRTEAEQTRIWDSGVRPAARPVSRGGSGSNHSRKRYPGGAVDVTEPDELENVLHGYPGILKPRRDPSIGDPPHFSGTGR